MFIYFECGRELKYLEKTPSLTNREDGNSIKTPPLVTGRNQTSNVFPCKALTHHVISSLHMSSAFIKCLTVLFRL